MAANLAPPHRLTEPRTLKQVRNLQGHRWAALMRHLRERSSYRDVLRVVESKRSPGTAWYLEIDREVLSELGRTLYYIDTTSGTTGSPKSRYVSIPDDGFDLQMLQRTLQYAGIRSSDVVLVLDIGDLNLYSMFRKVLPRQSVVFWGLRPPFEPSIAKALREVQPTIVFAFGNLLSRGAKQLQRYHLQHRRLRRLLYTGEVLQSAAVELFHKIRLECFGIYSSIELGFIGAECGAHDGMHIWEDVLRVNVTDTGETRRRVFKRQASTVRHGVFSATTLLGRAKPALEYSTGDVVWYTRKRCAC